MIRCIVVDDEPHAIELMNTYIGRVPGLEVVFSSTRPVEAFQYLQKNDVDLVFLDIHMPELDGIQFLKLLGGKARVILTTAYPEHALEGYEHDVVDYLLKPIMFDRFLKAVTKAFNLLEDDHQIHQQPTSGEENQDYIFVKTETRGKLLRLTLSDILYIEGLGNYVAIHTGKGKTICLITFRDLEAKLPAARFIRIHKSYIISLAHITAIEGNTVQLDKTSLPIGESYKQRLFEVLESKIISKGTKDHD
jgi:two-component system, LytTR family, response regulator